MSERGSSMPVLVYVAGASREHERVKKWAAAIDRSSALEITDRWFDSAHEWIGTDHTLTRREQQVIAEREQQEIRAARIFWMLWPETHTSAGAFIELGYALAHRFHVARNYDVIVSGAGAMRSIFTGTADYRSDSDALAFDAVIASARRQQPLAESTR